MNKPAIAMREEQKDFPVDAEAVLNTLSAAVVVVDQEASIIYLNNTGEQFFQKSAATLKGRPLGDLIPADSPLFALIEQVRHSAGAVSEYGVTLESPRIDRRLVNIQANVMYENPEWVVIMMQERSIADKIDRQLIHRGAARSVTAMAAMLAHEVKNPLSGIRGAAQLLEVNTAPQDRNLTNLILDEVDRICAMVDRMGVFQDAVPVERQGVNIHRVLDRVRQLAENGFGSHLRFTANYDPSLPPVMGNHDQLLQVFLNLVKNAAEAAPQTGGEIVLSTAYKHGVHFAMPSSGSQVHLPLAVTIRDNGEGIPEDIRPHLFDPFVTSKAKGSGLGLALVAKIVGDHGGIVEFESHSRRTTFRVLLPMFSPQTPPNGHRKT
ncbi:MAG: ATP-binding protein [Rhodospirillales bacterium]